MPAPSSSSERYVQIYRADGTPIVGGLIDVNPPKPQAPPTKVPETTVAEPQEEPWIHVDRRRQRKWKGTSD